MNLPEGHTDDMRIELVPGQAEALVDIMFEELPKFSDTREVCRKLQDRFGLSEEDALFAIDRVPGGIVRAITGNPENRPHPEKDPLAHIAFQRVWCNLPRRHLFSQRKKPSGPWLAWFEELRRRMNTSDQRFPAGYVANRAEPEE
jgi:hypothetical protein